MASPWSAIKSLFGGGPREVPSSAPPRGDLPGAGETAGYHGFSIHGGYLSSDEQSGDLTGSRRWRTYSEAIWNVPIAAASVRYRLDLAARPAWNVEPASRSPEAQAAAAYVEDVMSDMATPWSSVVRRHALTEFYGFTISEITAKVRADGRIGIANIAARPQATIERWDVDASGMLRGVWQRSPQTGSEVYLPRSKLLYTVDDSLTDSPEGVGLIRHIVEAVRQLRRYIQLEGWGYETDLRGMPIVRGPWAKMRADAAAGVAGAAQALANAEARFGTFVKGGHQFSPDRGILVDSSTYETATGDPSSVPKWSIESMRGDAAAATSVNVAIERLLRDIARVFGTESMLLGAGGSGSFALARDKTVALALAVDGVNKRRAAEFQRDVFERFLWPLAKMDPALMPRLVPEPVQVGDVEQAASAIAALASAGAPLTPGDPGSLDTVNALHSILGLPRRDNLGGPAMDPRLGPRPPVPEPTWLRTPPIVTPGEKP